MLLYKELFIGNMLYEITETLEKNIEVKMDNECVYIEIFERIRADVH